MDKRLTTIRTDHLKSTESADGLNCQRLRNPPRRRYRLASSAKNLIDQPLVESTKKSDKSLKAKILLPRSRRLPQNFFDDKKLNLCLDRVKHNTDQSEIETPTFRDNRSITFSEDSPFSRKALPKKSLMGKSQVYDKKLLPIDNKENDPLRANRLKNSIMSKLSKDSIFKKPFLEQPFITEFTLDKPHMPLRLRIRGPDVKSRTKLRLQHLPQIASRPVTQ